MALRYVRYFLAAQTKHDIHSPFVYKLVTEVINSNQKKDVYKDIEKIRKSMLKNHHQIQVRDYGAGFAGKKYTQRKISFIARNSAKSPRYARLLNRLITFLSPQVIVEMGTSVGISSLYMAAAAPQAQLITMEGCENTAQIASDNFKQMNIYRIRQVIGSFEDTIPLLLMEKLVLDLVFIDGNHRKEPVLAYFNACLSNINEHSCMVIDDINWSDGMRESWKIIKQNPRVTVTIDLFMMGLVFFNPEFSRQDFIIRF